MGSDKVGTTIPDEAGEEFANTFKEWHYLVNGLGAGLILGFILAVYLMIRMLRALRK